MDFTSTDSLITDAVAIELFGTMSEHTHTLLKALATRESEVSDGSKPVSTCLHRWRQRISCVLQQLVSETVVRIHARTKAAPATAVINGSIRADPDVRAHLRMHLLVRPPQPYVTAVEHVDVDFNHVDVDLNNDAP